MSFLDNADWARRHSDRYREAFDQIEALGRRCVQLLQTVEIPEGHLLEAVSSSLLARCLEHLNSFEREIRNGRVAPAQVSLRALIEAVFTLRAISSDNELLQQYLKEDKLQRLRLLRKLENVEHVRLKEFLDPKLKEELQKAVGDDDVKLLTTEFLAKKAGLYDWYLVVYALLTGPAHTKIRDLEQYIQTDDAGGIHAFSLAPTDEHTNGLISTAGLAMLYAVDAVEAVFDLGLEADRERYETYFTQLGSEEPLGVEEDPMEDPNKEYRALLIEREHIAQERYDKTVIALSSGALGISFAFVDDFIGDSGMTWTSLLLLAWISWGASLCGSLLSYFTSAAAFRKTRADLDASREVSQPGGAFDKLTNGLNIAAGVLFLLGVVFLICFVSANLGAK